MKYPIEQIRDFCEKVWVKVGLAPEDAKTCVDVLLAADIRGQRTHGTTHMKDYCERVRRGTSTTGQNIEIVQTGESTLSVDAGHAVGMVAAPKVMRACIEQAKKSGACFAAVRGGNHYGLGAYYPMMCMEENMIGFSVTNAPALVAPFGGMDPLLGTNPVSVAIPAGRYPGLVMDIATSVAAKGNIALAMKEGRDIPLGMALDKDGNPTTDAKAANEGVLLPFGAHKGYSISLIISVLAFALGGADMDINIPRFFEHTEMDANCGYFMGCIDVSRFCPVDVFKERIDSLFALIKACRPAKGSKGVLIPGEIEYNKTQTALKEGIDLSEATLRDFRDMADEYGVEYTF